MDKSIPDFTTVKVRPQPGGVRDHYIVCMMEIKRNNAAVGIAANQMIQYMKKAASHPSREEALRGYLVMGRDVIPFWVETVGIETDIVQGDSFDMFAAGDQFTTQLCEIAIRNWNA